MNELSADGGAYCPGEKPGVDAQAVIRFPDWLARGQVKGMGAAEKAVGRRGIPARPRNFYSVKVAIKFGEVQWSSC